MADKKHTEASTADLLVQQRISNRLLAAQLRTTMKQKDLIVLLAATGASHADIALIVGTTPATVQNALARTKKAGAPRRGKPAQSEDEE